MATETLKTMRDRIRARLRDPESRIWSDSDLNQWINLAFVDLQEKTGWDEDSYVQAITSNTATYTRTADRVHNMKHIVYDNYRLNAIDQYELDRRKHDWRTEPNNIPIRAYMPDWNVDGFYPTPNETGESFVYNSEFGVVVAISRTGDSFTFGSELGIFLRCYGSDPADDWISLPLDHNDPDTDSNGEAVMMQSPYKNAEMVFQRDPEDVSSDDDVLPFPFWTHYAAEEFVIARALNRPGDGRNPELAGVHDGLYRNVWLPWIDRILAQQTRDASLIWRGQDSGRSWANQLSQLSRLHRR